MRIAVSLLSFALVAVSLQAQTLFPARAHKEYRSTSASSYVSIVQKSGQVNIDLTSGEPVFTNVYPMVWLDGEEKPKPLPVLGKATSRREVSDKLGKGQGIGMTFKSCEWLHNTYPTEPYLTVQVAFTNTGKKPVRVKALMPWCTGDKRNGGFSLGAGTSECQVLENGRNFPGDESPPAMTRGAASSMWNLLALNTQNRRSLVAGFLTNDRAYTRIRFDNPTTDETFGEFFKEFSAECVYDPPVELQPGERLVSEVLYLSIAERDPFEGLERFSRHMAAVNNVSGKRPFSPHGWDSWNTEYRSDINEARVYENLDFIDKNLKRYGWTHFAIDDGWQNAKGDWEVNPERFPNGLRSITDAIHARGMTAGIWIAPFTVNVNSNLAKEHPDWLAAPNAQGREVVNEDDRILDVTAPGALDYVRQVAARISNEWGFDALMEADYVYHLLLAEKYHDTSLTRVEVFRKGMQALREGMGEDKFIMSFAPLAVTGTIADGMRLGNDCAPIWRKDPEKWPWGCVETMTTAARRYYFTPSLWSPDVDCAYFGHDATRARWDVADKPKLTRDQTLAWLTGQVMTGGTVLIGDRFSGLAPDEVAVLQKLLPTVGRARPIDLFEADNPQIWHLPVRSAVGNWSILALFNWDESAAKTVPVSFAKLGLDPEGYFTVYGFWEDKYYGIGQKQLEVNIPPGGVRLLALRPYENRPMFLSTNRHFSQGATDFKSLEWNSAARTLHGVFEGVANTDYTIRILIPDPYKAETISVSTGNATTQMEQNVLRIDLHCDSDGPVDWRLRF
ncbi:MAG: alpha-galactosidase [Candidatus Hydrogenedentes bacterium]|nr:alpha-galactosidase [Candidatus Hydrogenedentota bacterium]